MRRRFREVIGELGDAIIGGRYAEGTWLPSVTTLHEELGCSRGVVREAMRVLEERGLVEVHQGRGAKVRRREAWDTRNPDVLRACFELGPEPDALRLAIEARADLEIVAAERAIELASDGDFGLLVTEIERMRHAASGDEFVAAETWFHRTLMLLSGNEPLARLAEPWHALFAQLRRDRAPDRDAAAVRGHRFIVEGLSSRDRKLAADAIVAYSDRLTEWVGARR
jgi:DNA-binding FadR family transcriptional regulator